VTVRVNLNLPDAAVDALSGLASERGTTVTEVLRHAVSLERELSDVVNQGARILIEKDGQFRELVLFP
jgi:hypothetical protein